MDDDDLATKIAELINGNLALRSTVVDLLGLASLRDWVTAATSPMTVVRAAAIEAAANRDEPEVLRHLASMAEPGNEMIVEAFRSALGRSRAWTMPTAALDGLLADPDWRVRLAAVKELGTLAGSGPRLVEAACQDDDSDVWGAVRTALGALPVDEALGAIKQRCQPGSPPIVVWLLDALVEKHDELVVPSPPLDDAWNWVGAQLRSNPHQSWCATLRSRLSRSGMVTSEVSPDPRLLRFGVDLTAELLNGGSPSTHVERSLLEDLASRLDAPSGSRSFALRGPSGVGKTAIVHALTRHLHGDGWRVLQMTSSDFLVGTKWLGEWQTRASEIVKLLARPERIVLFVPNVDELLSAGRSSSSDDTVLSHLRPSIESGDISVIGETTPEAFAAGLGSDPSTVRILDLLDVPEASAAQTEALCWLLAADADLDLDERLVRRVRELSDEYLGDVARPGRTLGLLRRSLQLVQAGAPVSARVLLDALSESTGVPADLLDDSVPLDLDALRRRFEGRVMGQPGAVQHALDVVTLIKAGLTNPDRPNSVMLFVGPTGVGKTELARALAEVLFGDPDRLVRVDLSEFASFDAFERLIGRNGPGVLTDPVRRHPFSVVLLDEIEKSHLNVFDLLLQVFDAGRLRDAGGRVVNFRNTVVIMTSNVGSRIDTSPATGFGEGSARPPATQQIRRELERFFRPEFLGRIDRLVVFDPLSLEVAERITRREIGLVLERSGITRRDIAVDVDPSVVDFLVRVGYSPAFGARPLKRTVEQHLLMAIGRELATNRARAGSLLRASAVDDRVVITRVRSGEGGPDRGEATAPASEGQDLLDRILAETSLWHADLLGRRSQLLHDANEPEVWSDDARRSVVLEAAQRVDELVERVERLQREAGRTRENPDHRRRHRFLVSHRLEYERLRATMQAGSLADAFVVVTALGGASSGLDAVGLTASMYRAFATRWGWSASVLSDCRDPESGSDRVTLIVEGAGAAALLDSEAGIHQWRQRDGRANQRAAVRVDVFAVPETSAPGARISVRPLAAGTQDRWGDDRTAEVSVTVGGPSRAGQARGSIERTVVAWVADQDARTIEDIGLWAQAHAEAVEQGVGDTGDQGVVRRYDLGDQPRIRDARTGASTGRVGDVLAGGLDEFVLGLIAT